MAEQALRPPTFAGLRPELPRYETALPAQAAAVRALFGGAGEVLRRCGGGPGLAGLYRHIDPGGGSCFVKIVPRERRDELRLADALAHALCDAGAPVVAPGGHSGSPVADGLVAFSQPWRQARFARVEVADVTALGRALGRLHAAMRTVRVDAAIRERARERRRFMARTRDAVLASPLGVGPRPAALRALLDRSPVWLDPDDGHGLVHGDVNYTNALFDAASPGGAWFLDLENATKLWCAPCFDVAKALERFCWCAPVDSARQCELAEAMLDAYAASCARERRWRPGALVAATRVQHAQPLCLLASAAMAGRDTDEGEWTKFLFLDEQLERREDELRELDARYA